MLSEIYCPNTYDSYMCLSNEPVELCGLPSVRVVDAYFMGTFCLQRVVDDQEKEVNDASNSYAF